MTNRTSPFLSRCRDYWELCDRCHALDDDIAYWQRKVVQMQNSDSHSDLLAGAPAQDQLAALYRQCAVLCSLRAAQEAALARVIDALPQQRLRTLLRYRYLERCPWAEVSSLLSLDDRWVYRLHRRALGLVDAGLATQQQTETAS